MYYRWIATLAALMLSLGVRAQTRFPALLPSSDDYYTLGGLAPETPRAADWFRYVQATTYATGSLQRFPDVEINTVEIPPELPAGLAKLLMANLTVEIPGEGFSLPRIVLTSVFPATAAAAQRESREQVKLIPFRPSNPHMSGFISEPADRFGGLRLRVTYTLQDSLKNKVYLEPMQELQIVSGSDGWEMRYGITLELYDASFGDIRFGLLEADLIGEEIYEQVNLTPDLIGREILIGHIPAILTEWQPGVVHLMCPRWQLADLLAMPVWGYRGDFPLREGYFQAHVFSPQEYTRYRARPGLTYKQFVRQMPEVTDAEVSDTAVVVFQTGYEADRLRLSRLMPDELLDIRAGKALLFAMQPEGEYRVSHLKKGEDGILRPWQNDRAHQPPVYTRGRDEMYRAIQSSVRYPAEAQENGIQGTVMVLMKISAEGKVVDARIEQSVDPVLDEEAMRVVRLLEQWQPGTVDGEPVVMNVVLPISFRLN